MKDNKISFGEFAKENKLVLILFGVLILGILFGCIAYKNFSVQETSTMSIFAQDYMNIRAKESSGRILSQSFFSGTAVMIILFVSGLCAVGQPIEIFMPFVKGLGLGASVAQIYALKGGKGLLIVLLLVVPYAVITCFVYVISVKESLRLSNKLFEITFFKGHNDEFRVQTKMYCMKFIFLEIIIAIAALVDWFCTVVFADMLLK